MDVHGKAVLRKQLRRSEMARFFANLDPCLVGMEACGSSHHWVRKLGEIGHIVVGKTRVVPSTLSALK